MLEYVYIVLCISKKETRKGENYMKITKKLGMLLLGIWLILTGLLEVMSIPIPAIGMLLAVLAIASGALILLGK